LTYFAASYYERIISSSVLTMVVTAQKMESHALKVPCALRKRVIGRDTARRKFMHPLFGL